MFAITVSEALNTLAAFSEAFDVCEWVEKTLLFRKSTVEERLPKEISNNYYYSEIQTDNNINSVRSNTQKDDENHLFIAEFSHVEHLPTTESERSTKCDQIKNETIQREITDPQQDRLLESMEEQILRIPVQPGLKSMSSSQKHQNQISDLTAENFKENEELNQTEYHSKNSSTSDNSNELPENHDTLPTESLENGQCLELDQVNHTARDSALSQINNNELKEDSEKLSVANKILDLENTEISQCQNSISNSVSDIFNLSQEHTDSKTDEAISNNLSNEVISNNFSEKEYVSTASLQKDTENASESKNTLNTEDCSEPERLKKSMSSAWNPVPLVEHLYRITPEHVKIAECYGDNIESYVNILSYGAFYERGGQFYVSIKEGQLLCKQSKEESKIILDIFLKYAITEVRENNVLVLENKLGRSIHFQFDSEEELQEWKVAVQMHCVCLPTSKFLMPVHYPLKCHKKVVIVDLGSCSVRAGILMDEPTLPSIFFPTVCATDKITGKQLYGMEALLPDIRQSSTLTFPVRPSAKITKFTMDIDALRGLFVKIFRDLNIDPKLYKLQLSIPRSLSTDTQIALTKLLLEDIGVQALSLTRQSLLTMYANNTTTAIVVDIGDRLDVLPVVDGFILETAVKRLPYGGQRIIHHLKHALAQKHISLTNDVESFVVQYIMENLCYIAKDYEEEIQQFTKFPESIKKTIPLHTFFHNESCLQNVSLDIGRFQVPEGLFNPDLWGLDFPGIHKLVHQAIQVAGIDVRKKMTESIYVSGGVSLIPGFVERLQTEITKLTLPRLTPQVHASPYRYHMAYLGACQLASSDAFSQVCVDMKNWKKDNLSCLKKWCL